MNRYWVVWAQRINTSFMIFRILLMRYISIVEREGVCLNLTSILTFMKLYIQEKNMTSLTFQVILEEFKTFWSSCLVGFSWHSPNTACLWTHSTASSFLMKKTDSTCSSSSPTSTRIKFLLGLKTNSQRQRKSRLQIPDLLSDTAQNFSC